MVTFGNRLKELRVKKGLNQDELADRFKISRSAVGMYERDERRPDFDLLNSFADFFDVSTDYLIGRSDYPKMTAAQSSLKNIEDIRDDIYHDRVNDVDGKPFTPESKANYLQQLDLLIQLRKLQTQNK